MRIIIQIVCSLFLFPLYLTANTTQNEFIHLNKNELLFQKQFNLGKDYLKYDYDITIEYPEYTPLSKKEINTLKSQKFVPQEYLQIQKSLGVSRKEGILDAWCIPVIKKDKKWLHVSNFKISLKQTPISKSKLFVQNKTPGKRYAKHSVLSKGKWAKIRVREEGIYALTPALLSSMGFQNINKVKVYGYGGKPLPDVISPDEDDSLTDDLEEVPLYRRAKDVLFFAEGTRRFEAWKKFPNAGNYHAQYVNNPYSQYAYYFVTEGDSILEIPTEEVSQNSTAPEITTIPSQVIIDNDEFSWYTSGRNLYEAYNYGKEGNVKNYNIKCEGIVEKSKVGIQWSFTASSSSRTQAVLSISGKTLSTLNINAIGSHDLAQALTGTCSSSDFQEQNTLSIKSTQGVDAHLDFIKVNYTRNLSLTGAFLAFSHYQEGGAKFILSKADQNTKVWKIGTAGHPTSQIKTTLTDGKLIIPVNDATKQYVAFNASETFPSPEFSGKVVNQDLHTDSMAQMVIIVPESNRLTSQAERLAQYHRNKHNLKVKVVRADEIFNEFSSGTPDAVAYRRYLKMLYDKAESETLAPKYLLLFGSCAWDNRMLTQECKGLNPKDFLLCYESENSLNEVNSYVTDDYFGLLDDGEGENILSEKIDLGIGRFPVSSEDEAKIVVDKSIAYMDNQASGAWKNKVYLLADDGEKNDFMEDAEDVANILEKKYPDLMTKRIYWDAYQRQASSTGFTYPDVSTEIKDIMNNKGALVMNYIGHGAPYSISHEMVLKLADFKNAFSAKVPLWVIASCEIAPYDMLEETIGESALLNKKGAAIGFYCASRAVYSTENSYLNNYFMDYIFSKDSLGNRLSMGDAARLTKVSLVNSSGENNPTDFSNNKAKYALLGDPALIISMPTQHVVIDKINGKQTNNAELPQLQAGSIISVEGHIENEFGKTLPNFTGAITLTLMDSEDTITTRNNDQGDVEPFVYHEYTKTLYEGTDSVKSGKFKTSIPIPMDIKYTDLTGKLSLYAINNEKSLEANGTCYHFRVGGTDKNAIKEDGQGPSIYLYLNTPEFQDGDWVNETPYFMAQLSDSDGINATGNGIGHDLELIIDGKESQTYVINNYYTNDFGGFTSGKVQYMIPTLEEGAHKLYFRAWDMKNHSSSAVLNFKVKSGLQPEVLKARLSNNPASTSTTFLIKYNRPNLDTKFTINVYDCFGRLWWTHEEDGSSPSGLYTIDWNLNSNNGVALPDGLYLYKVSITCNGSEESCKTEKLIIYKQ